MTTIALVDRDISVTEYSNFELNIQLKYGVVKAHSEAFELPHGDEVLRLTDVVVTFDEKTTPAAEIESCCLANGFRRKDES